jgi:hypothetical protein
VLTASGRFAAIVAVGALAVTVVLLLAVTVDSISRRAQASSGRA